MATRTMDRTERSGDPTSDSTRHARAGRGLTALAVLFLIFDGVTKVMHVEPVKEAMADLGYAEGLAPGIGLLLLVCVALHLLPRTAVLGAILLTAFLGGAVASQVRVGNPLLSHTLFPVYVALMLWGGLYLREHRLRALVPLRRRP
jgi:hypothetical protein